MTQHCIYCRSTSGPFTDEHVVAKSVGGNLLIPDVCRSCNGGVLSAIDQALAERSPVALDRVLKTPPASFATRLGGAQFVRQEDLWLEVEIVNGFAARPLPQIHARLPWQPGPTDLRLAAPSAEAQRRFIELIDRRVRKGRFLDTRVRVGPVQNTTSIRLFQHQSNDLSIRVLEPAQAPVFLTWFMGEWPAIKAANSSGEPTSMPLGTSLEMQSVTRPDDYLRAIAKTALNYLSYVAGPAFALRTEFDDLRAYVLGLNLVPDPGLLAAGEVAFDTRFVRPMPRGHRPMIRTPNHQIILATHAGRLTAHITLYGRHQFAVTMGALRPGEEIFECREFAGDRQRNSSVPVEEMMRRYREDNNRPRRA